MPTRNGFIVLTASAFALAIGAVPSFAFTGEQQYGSQAKVSIEQARSIALKKVPGKITDEELGKEKGGSGLRYSFDIAYKGKTREVGVDAVTGDVLENSIEGPNAD